MNISLRSELVKIALKWEEEFVVAPSITSALSEYDAAMLLGCSEAEYKESMHGRTAVSRGYDFCWQKIKYQVKGTRPSGKPGSKVTKVPKPKDDNKWDILIWVLYDKNYNILEAWEWKYKDFMNHYGDKERISPDDMRNGKKLK